MLSSNPDAVLAQLRAACLALKEADEIISHGIPAFRVAGKMFGHTTAGLFGYTHLTGGYAGGQAEYLRVPFADVAPMKVPDGMDDESVLFLTDILPTGWQAAEHCEIKGGDIVAVWGAGPVGLFAIQSAIIMVR